MSVVGVIFERKFSASADLVAEGFPDGEQKISDRFIAEVDAIIEHLEPQILNI